MVLDEDTGNRTRLLPAGIENLIPEDHVCFFIAELVNSIDFEDIDSKYRNTPGQKAYPAAMLVRIIVMGFIYSVYSSHKLELLVRENIVFMYLAGFKKPSASTIAAFKREHMDLIEKIFLKTVDCNYPENLINHSRSIDAGRVETSENGYENLTDEEVAGLLYIVRKKIIFDEEENRALENRKNMIVTESYTGDEIMEALKKSKNLKLKDSR